jgi:signal transduction histidine kinase
MPKKSSRKNGLSTGSQRKKRSRTRRGQGKKHANVTDELISLFSDELLTSLPHPMLLYDPHMTIIYANAFAIESLGFDPIGLSRDEMMDKINLNIENDSTVAEQDYVSAGAMAGQTIRNIYYQFRDTNGKLHTVLGSSSPLEQHEEIIGVVDTWFDITEFVKRENLILFARDEMERLVQERTHDLIESQKKLERLKRLSNLGTLAATVAHELRNPLGVIGTAAYNLRRKITDPSLERHIDNIDKKIAESSMVINNLLNYSKIQNPRLRRVWLSEVLAESIKSVKKRFRQKPVKVSKRLGRLRDLSLMADPGHLREVFLNILNNAVQAVEAGGMIRISADRNGESVVVEITDNGAGIDKADIDKVFDPFFTRRAKGTGLGLAICRELVEMHGGSISIRSELGTGTLVSVKLPLERKDHE